MKVGARSLRWFSILLWVFTSSPFSEAAIGNDAWDAGFAVVSDQGSINAVAFDEQGRIFIAGSFSGASFAKTATNIAAWDGKSWSALERGVNGAVQCMAYQSNSLYVGGTFTRAG